MKRCSGYSPIPIPSFSVMLQCNSCDSMILPGTTYRLNAASLCDGSPASGKLAERLTPGELVNPGTMVGRIEPSAGGKIEVRTKVPGTLEQWAVPDGTVVAAGQTLLRLDPSSDMAWEALRALYIIGRPEDEATIVPFVHGVAGMPANVATQASATLQAIRSRHQHRS